MRDVVSGPPDIDALMRHTRRLAWRAQALLFWERYAPVFALAGLLVALFLIATFGGVWERIGDPWRLVGLVATLACLALAAWKARLRQFPGRSEARRRVETDSGVKHRPLDTLEDRPALGGAGWSLHHAHAGTLAQNLKPPKGRPTLAPIDPCYLRLVLPVLIVLAMLVGAGDNFERLQRALKPAWQTGIAPARVSFEAWVDPPDYTGRPPIYFRNTDTIDVPAGSELVARISGTRSPTRLKISTRRRSHYLPLTHLGGDSFETRTRVNEDTLARWRVGNRIKSWHVSAVTDQPPRLSVTGDPEADKRDRLSITYSFTDDYGVEELFLIMKLHTDDADRAGETSRVDIPLSGPVREAQNSTRAIDLTRHKWAGKKVMARLYVRDGAGQSAGSRDLYFIVPDRIFIEPLAKAVIEQRGLVLAAQDQAYAPAPDYSVRDWQTMPSFDTYEPRERLDRAPAEIRRAAELIGAVTDSPSGLFRDPAVYMGLKNIESRLRYAREAKALSGIPEDLWSIAIRAEFGVLGSALEEMREAEAALREGMARRAPQREIDTLFERYNAAVDRYMDELRRQALEEGRIAQDGGDGRSVDEIEELLKAIEEANRIGDTEGARRALARLAELLENMQLQLSAGGGGSGGAPMENGMSEEMKKALEDLADMLGEQRDLQDETRRAERGAQNGEQNGDQGNRRNQTEPGVGALSPRELARQQQGLEQALEALREAVPQDDGDAAAGEPADGATGGSEGEGENQDGMTRDALNEAARAMGESRRALDGEQFGEARTAQDEAIKALRRAGEALARQAAENRREGQENRATGNYDPLGRGAGGVGDENAEADMDRQDNATKSREILEELRRRAGEQDREQIERDYLERLLNRF